MYIKNQCAVIIIGTMYSGFHNRRAWKDKNKQQLIVTKPLPTGFQDVWSLHTWLWSITPTKQLQRFTIYRDVWQDANVKNPGYQLFTLLCVHRHKLQKLQVQIEGGYVSWTPQFAFQRIWFNTKQITCTQLAPIRLKYIFINTPDSFATPIGGERVDNDQLELFITSWLPRVGRACANIITRNAQFIA